MPAYRKKMRVLDDDETGTAYRSTHQVRVADVESTNIPDNDADSDVSDHVDESGGVSSEDTTGAAEPTPDEADKKALYTKAATRGVDNSLLRRIGQMRSYSDPSRGIYYITLLPKNLRWGREEAFKMSNFLVRPDNMAITVWVVGRIALSALFDEFGKPQERAYINIMPVYLEDLDAATEIMNLYANPRKSALTTNPFRTIMASRMQTKWQSDKPAQAFRGVYLADSGLKPKWEMLRYDASKLQRGDLVMVEMRVRKRFETAGEGGDDPKSHDEHAVAFHLNAINFLQPGTDSDVPDLEDNVYYGF